MSGFIKWQKTERGFLRGTFTDMYDEVCSIQASSLATESAIWLGINEVQPKVLIPGRGWQPVELPDDALCSGRMHLTQTQVKDLLPALQYFAEHGELPQAEG